MTQAEKLEALIGKARENGFVWLADIEVRSRSGWLDGKQQTEPYIAEYMGVSRQYVRDISWQVLVYRHAFAKALFGESVLQSPAPVGPETYRTEDTYIDETTGTIEVKPLLLAYQYHLQQAVISEEDPIDYMYSQVFPEDKD